MNYLFLLLLLIPGFLLWKIRNSRIRLGDWSMGIKMTFKQGWWNQDQVKKTYLLLQSGEVFGFYRQRICTDFKGWNIPPSDISRFMVDVPALASYDVEKFWGVAEMKSGKVLVTEGRKIEKKKFVNFKQQPPVKEMYCLRKEPPIKEVPGSSFDVKTTIFPDFTYEA